VNPTLWCWAFEARSIQDYLFETGRLADAVGASLLVDRLTGDLADAQAAPAGACDDLLSSVLRAAGAQGRLRFSRRAGGAFVAFADERALLVRARLLWHAALLANAPGLRWSDGLAAGDDAQQAARAALAQAQARGQFDPPRLPEASAAQRRVPRTGQPAQRLQRLGAKGLEPVDAATTARRRHRAAAARRLTARFADLPGLRWPTDLDPQPPAEADGDDDSAFPFVGGNRDVAFVHADGNGLGVLLRRLDGVEPAARYIEVCAGFSLAISRATQAAAAQATAEVLLPACVGSRVPARPLVLGGDDLQVIVRADLATGFVASYLQAFEQHSARHLAPLCEVLGLAAGQGLTAAAGVLVAKANYPFAAAAARAGSLCERAKRAIKREAAAAGRALPLAAVALERAQASLADEGDAALPGGIELGLPAYALTTQATALPRWQDLHALAVALGAAAAPRGPARRLIADLHEDLNLARERYRRMQQVQGVAWAPVAEALRALGVPTAADLPLTAAGATPWPDALLLRDLAAAPAATPTALPEHA
jgi:hypothetical protein